MKNNPIICAIDSHNFEESLSLIHEIHNDIYAIKLGLEFFMAFGIDGVKSVIAHFPKIKIFLDLKFHDIPNTVCGALKSIIDIENIFLTTIHASGGAIMIKEAMNIAKNRENLKIICVTKLTSLAINIDDIIDLTKISLENEAHGIVCPANSLSSIKEKFSVDFPDFITVCPGIRLDSTTKKDDQQAISTPKNAMRNGADYLVIGRPITQAANKIDAINSILKSISD